MTSVLVILEILRDCSHVMSDKSNHVSMFEGIQNRILVVQVGLRRYKYQARVHTRRASSLMTHDPHYAK